jgi:hypothetical protein
MDKTIILKVLKRYEQQFRQSSGCVWAGHPGFNSKWGWNFSFRHHFQNDSAVHMVSYPMNTTGEVTETCRWPSLSSRTEIKRAWSFISTPPIRLHGLMFRQKDFTLS